MGQLTQWMENRKTVKAFDSSKLLTPEQISDIESILRYAPSSINSQPWHYVLASTEEGKKTLAKGLQGTFVFNEPKVMNAPLAVVLCTRTTIDESYLQSLITKEEQDGRFATPEAKAQVNGARAFFVNGHRYEKRDLQHWLDKQVYLALGMLLLGAEAMGIHACPIEGFDQKALDDALDLPAKGFMSTVMVALGHRSEQDANANIPKSRFSESSIFTRI